MTTERSPIVQTEGMRLTFLRHPDDEFFDRVEGTMPERWKESELSGDEWRFSHTVNCYSHGVLVAVASGGTLREALGRVAALWSGLIHGDEGWADKRTEVEARCCQPGCEEPWAVLYHPVKAYTKSGAELVRPYKDGTGSLPWLDVRGFCERHRHRGDCALDDGEFNYVEVLPLSTAAVAEGETT